MANVFTEIPFVCNLIQVKKIVTGQFNLFHSMYKPFLEEYEAKKILRLSSTANHQVQVFQVFMLWFYLFLVFGRKY